MNYVSLSKWLPQVGRITGVVGAIIFLCWGSISIDRCSSDRTIQKSDKAFSQVQDVVKAAKDTVAVRMAAIATRRATEAVIDAKREAIKPKAIQAHKSLDSIADRFGKSDSTGAILRASVAVLDTQLKLSEARGDSLAKDTGDLATSKRALEAALTKTVADDSLTHLQVTELSNKLHTARKHEILLLGAVVAVVAGLVIFH